MKRWEFDNIITIQCKYVEIAIPRPVWSKTIQNENAYCTAVRRVPRYCFMRHSLICNARQDARVEILHLIQVSNDVLWPRTRFERVKLKDLRWMWRTYSRLDSEGPMAGMKNKGHQGALPVVREGELAASGTSWLQLMTLAQCRIRWSDLVIVLCDSI